MKKVGILNIQGENFLGRNYGVSGRVGLPGESFMGGNYPGGSFPRGIVLDPSERIEAFNY